MLFLTAMKDQDAWLLPAAGFALEFRRHQVDTPWGLSGLGNMVSSTVQPELEISPLKAPDMWQETETRGEKRQGLFLCGIPGSTSALQHLGMDLGFCHRGRPKASGCVRLPEFHSQVRSTLTQGTILPSCCVFSSPRLRRSKGCLGEPVYTPLADCLGSCVRTAISQRETFSLGDTGRNWPKVFGRLHLSKGLHESFFGHGQIISLVVNFYPVKQHVFPARLRSFLAQANGA